MIRATLDVNVLASGFAAETGTPSELIARWTDLEYELVISEHILEGLARTYGIRDFGTLPDTGVEEDCEAWEIVDAMRARPWRFA